MSVRTGALILQKPEDAVRELREMGREAPGRSLVDELLTERRAAADA